MALFNIVVVGVAYALLKLQASDTAMVQLLCVMWARFGKLRCLTAIMLVQGYDGAVQQMLPPRSGPSRGGRHRRVTTHRRASPSAESAESLRRPRLGQAVASTAPVVPSQHALRLQPAALATSAVEAPAPSATAPEPEDEPRVEPSADERRTSGTTHVVDESDESAPLLASGLRQRVVPGGGGTE